MDELKNLDKVNETEIDNELNLLDGEEEVPEKNEHLTSAHRNSLFDEPLPSDKESLCAALDGILLVHNKPITYEKLASVLGISVPETETLVNQRKKDYDRNKKCGLQIAILDNGIQLATKAMISPFIQRLDGQKLVSLSLPALETLSVIAFKQPITKAEIDAVRGVNSEGVVSTLLEKKLIYISGEKEALGKPRLYSTTQDFLYYFGMNSLKELPVPSIDISEVLTPEGQKPEIVEKRKEAEKDFNASQGFVPIEENNNEMGEMSEPETNTVEDSSFTENDFGNETEPNNIGE